MPKSYEVTRSINASPEVIWRLLTDVSQYARWNPAVVKLEGTIAVGEKLKLVSSVNAKRTFTPKVAALEPPRRMVWADGMPGGLFKGERTYTLTPESGGGTSFHMREAFTGPLSGLIAKSIPDLTDSFAAFADGLKREAEGSS